MKIFLDTANLEEIQKAAGWGILDGITTNPTLIAKENAPFAGRILEICHLVQGPVSAEVTATTHTEMVEEAKRVAAIHPNVVVKIPMIPDGVQAVVDLSKDGIKTNVTLVFSAVQAILAAKAGATYVSPFAGRLDDIGHVGMELVEQIRTIFDNYGFRTQIILASVRDPMHVIEGAMAGADVATIPFSILEKCFKHPLTDLGLARFMQDWEEYQRKQGK